MTATANFLFALYALELLTLMGGMAYVMYLWLTRRAYINPHLQGRRLKVAAMLPVLWFIYVYSDAYAVYTICEAQKWQVPDGALMNKAIRELVSLTGAGITTLFMIGYKFE